MVVYCTTLGDSQHDTRVDRGLKIGRMLSVSPLSRVLNRTKPLTSTNRDAIYCFNAISISRTQIVSSTSFTRSRQGSTAFTAFDRCEAGCGVPPGISNPPFFTG
jgi:hypothetical protein